MEKNVDNWKEYRIRRNKNKYDKGKKTEDKIVNILSEKYGEKSIIKDIYLEMDYLDTRLYRVKTGVKERINMYPTVQIDAIMVLERSIFLLEIKGLSDATSKGKLVSKGSSYFFKDGKGVNHVETNSSSQCLYHENIIKKLFAKEHIDFLNYKIINMVIYDGIDANNINVLIDSSVNLVTSDELISRIDYLRKISKDRNDLEITEEVKYSILKYLKGISDDLNSKYDNKIEDKHYVYIQKSRKASKRKN